MGENTAQHRFWVHCVRSSGGGNSGVGLEFPRQVEPAFPSSIPDAAYREHPLTEPFDNTWYVFFCIVRGYYCTLGLRITESTVHSQQMHWIQGTNRAKFLTFPFTFVP